MEGYRSVSLKGEVVERLQRRAKEEDKKLSSFVNELLEEKEKGNKKEGEKGEELTEEKIRKIIKEEVTAILEEVRRW